jgi:hypothetical protein
MARTTIPLSVKKQVYSRFATSGRQCECNHPFHDHSINCPKVIKGKPYFQPRYHPHYSEVRSWFPTVDNTIAVCRDCNAQIDMLRS